jgi:MerR HTH family regulatory protein
MQFVTTREASTLTGLSTDQLREWTNRRALIPADVRPKGHGSPAKYAWQTILLLRIAVTLRDRFRVELQTHRELFASLRQNLPGTSFIDLWDKSLAIYGGDHWRLLDDSEQELGSEDAIVVRLAPHLEVLSVGFALPHPATTPGQLELFPAQGLPSPRKVRPPVRGTGPQLAKNKRRRSA